MVDSSRLAFMSLDGSAPDLDGLERSPMVAFDAETTSTDALTAALLGVSMCNNPSSAYFFPSGYPRFPSELLADNCIPKIAHNAIFDRSALKQHGIIIDNIIDTMIAAHMVGEMGLRLKTLAARRLGLRIKAFEDLRKPMSELSLDELAGYSCPHSTTAWALWQVLEPELRRWGSMDLFTNIEMPLVPVLSDMELAGAAIDAENLRALGVEFEAKARMLEDALDYHSGTQKTNWNSPDQVAWVLYDKLGLPKGPMTKKGKRPTTNATYISTLKGRHPVVNLLLQDRQYRKLKGTYVDGILDRMVDGRIHTDFNQTGTRTGRLSSTDPNLQNIPVRTPEGKRIRRAFVAAPGCILIKADCDQVELKMIAHYSQEPKLIQAFLNGEDVHLKVAVDVFKDPKRRFEGKTMNFLTIYGGGDKLVAQKTGWPLPVAKKWRERYFEVYNVLDNWIRKTREHCRESGYARTMHGRARVIEEFNHTWLLEHAYREAISTIIQGSSSELVKIAMIKAWNVLRDSSVKPILQVHDELVLEVPETIARDVVEVLQLTLPYNELSIPITWTITMGYNWQDMEEPIWPE